jgi:hypothetical protein
VRPGEWSRLGIVDRRRSAFPHLGLRSIRRSNLDLRPKRRPLSRCLWGGTLGHHRMPRGAIGKSLGATVAAQDPRTRRRPEARRPRRENSFPHLANSADRPSVVIVAAPRKPASYAPGSGGKTSIWLVRSFTRLALGGNRGKVSKRAWHFGQCQTCRIS